MGGNMKSMTIGQMRRIVMMSIKAVPTDLTYEEAARILRARKQLRNKLESVWSAARLTQPICYNVKLPSGTVDEIIGKERVHTVNFRRGDDPYKNFTLTGNEHDRRGVVAVEIRRYRVETPAEIKRLLEKDGYRSADIYELLAFASQHRSIAAEIIPQKIAGGAADCDFYRCGSGAEDGAVSIMYGESFAAWSSWWWNLLTVRL
jgi:hypothetical protein